MALPEKLYRDPSLVVEFRTRLERALRRERDGCTACVNHEIILGHRLCMIDQVPGVRGFCKKWEEKIT